MSVENGPPPYQPSRTERPAAAAYSQPKSGYPPIGEDAKQPTAQIQQAQIQQPTTQIWNASANLSFLILALVLCIKGFIENLGGLRLISEMVVSTAYADTNAGGIFSDGGKSVIGVIISFALLVILIVTAWAAYLKDPPNAVAQQHLPTITTTTFVLLSGILGVTLK
jgi:hypothetical protein